MEITKTSRTARRINETKRQRPRRWREWLGIALIILAIILALYPVVANELANRTRFTVTQHYAQTTHRLSAAEIRQQLMMAHDYNRMIAAHDLGSSNYVCPYPYQRILATPGSRGVIAVLKIPAIDISGMPIYHTTSESVLMHGIGHIEGTSMPVGGKNTRAVISGHSGIREQILFSNVDKLHLGDMMYIKVLKRTLAYKIHDMKVVLPTQVHSIRVKRSRDELTLLTCTPIGINSHRLLVTGRRVPYHAGEDDQPTAKRDLFDFQHIVLYCLGLFALYLVGRGIDRLVQRRRRFTERGRYRRELLETGDAVVQRAGRRGSAARRRARRHRR